MVGSDSITIVSKLPMIQRVNYQEILLLQRTSLAKDSGMNLARNYAMKGIPSFFCSAFAFQQILPSKKTEMDMPT